MEPTPEDWARIGGAIKNRIDELQTTQAKVIRATKRADPEGKGISAKTLHGWIRGAPIRYPDKARYLCAAIEWDPESIRSMLEGGDPIPMLHRPDREDELSSIRRDLDMIVQRVEDLAAEMRQSAG